jgi:low affinity Fe/Cu permease
VGWKHDGLYQLSDRGHRLGCCRSALQVLADSWQLIINTITNVATFVMVFLIQRAQNKDALAVQIKLSELLAAARGSEDPIVAIEALSESELRALHARYLERVRRGDRPPPAALESPPSSHTIP